MKFRELLEGKKVTGVEGIWMVNQKDRILKFLNKKKAKIVKDIKKAGVDNKEDILQAIRDDAGEYASHLQKASSPHRTDWSKDEQFYKDIYIEFAKKLYSKEW